MHATNTNERAGKQLPERFQLAIDQAAMSAGLIGDDKYTEGFQWGAEEERAGTAEEVAEAIVAELDKKFPAIDWKATARKLKEQ